MPPLPAITSAQVADALGLQPHPEGGFFRETFRATQQIDTPRGRRALATGILFLLTANSPSRFHRLASDELWVHQAGAAVQLVLLLDEPQEEPSAERIVTLATVGTVGRWRGRGMGAQAAPQATVPAGVWQGARLAPDSRGRDWALVTCIVVPGFDYADFELARRDALLARHPHLRELILLLT
jgi:predicted cupin superfamily sugar epimerase